MLSVGVAVFVLVTINGIVNYMQARSGLKESVTEIIARTGENTTRFVSNWFKVKSQIVSGAAEALQMGNDIQNTVQQGQLAGKFEVMYVGAGDGRMLTYPAINLPADYDPRSRPWYQQAQQARKQIVTPPYQDASSGNIVMTFAQPADADVIAADVELGDVVNEVLGVKIGESGYAALIDGEGKFLVHPDKSMVGKSLSSMGRGVRLNNTAQEIEIKDKNWLAATFEIDGVDWKLLLAMEESDAMSGLGMIAFTNVLISAVTIAMVVLVSGFMISYLLQPLVTLNKAMSDICKGDADLTRRLDVASNDEIGRLSQSFNRFVSIIHDLVADTMTSSTQLTALSNSARDNAQNNNSAIQLQQSEISQVAAAINEMSTTSSHVADNATDTATAAQSAAEEGNNGMKNAEENKMRMERLTKQIDETTVAINRLDEQGQQINSILATIQGIAEQTNLLALNAAIEAARAGEQGRGFAVVADEVRALSGRTHEATGEIQNVIKELQEQTQNAVSIMEDSKALTAETGTSAQEVTSSLMRIAEAIEDISGRANTIANASREQYTSTEEINRIATAIHDASNQLAENVHQATTQSDELHVLSEQIDGNLSRFKVN
ncbi:methyl-accepting chemotaxis protein [Planctobacterium marinum]|uniref:Methyl-accepting chemotaxis protein n=2 Tax=Planctobacterium marinum TaxID=1631968 RepID=A0AA48HXU9_9ALTE|nr:methyl-accepting chemotaxis protein [Planctobacterium marinum]